MLLIVNYHHIDNENKYSGGIYPVSPQRLSNQIEELGKKFEFIDEKDLVSAIEKRRALPPKSCLITFDDGLKNQYENAIPILENKNIPAVFYINTLPIASNRACLIHKMHFILTKISPDNFLKKITSHYSKITGRELSLDIIYNSIKFEKIYDNEKLFKLKYIFNRFLNPKITKKIVEYLFKEYCDDEKYFCKFLYLEKENLVDIHKHKLFSLGLHTDSHLYTSTSTEGQIRQDIFNNYKYFKNELLIESVYGIAYPKGVMDEETFNNKIKKSFDVLGLRYGLTMARELNDNLSKPALLKRFDTNDVVGGRYPILNI